MINGCWKCQRTLEDGLDVLHDPEWKQLRHSEECLPRMIRNAEIAQEELAEMTRRNNLQRGR